MLCSSSFDGFESLCKLVVDALEHVLEVDVELRGLTEQLVPDPVLVSEHLSSIEVANVRIVTAHLCALVELSGQTDQLINVSLRLALGLLGQP